MSTEATTSPADQERGPSMTVRVRDRAAEAPWGSGLTNPAVRTVTISATCPRCGGPRGEARNLNQYDDGVHYSTEVWDNPCGHVDLYVNVLREARDASASSEEQE